MNILEVIKYCSESKQERRLFESSDTLLYHLVYNNERLYLYDLSNHEELKQLTSSYIFDLYGAGLTFKEVEE